MYMDTFLGCNVYFLNSPMPYLATLVYTVLVVFSSKVLILFSRSEDFSLCSIQTLNNWLKYLSEY